MFHSDDPYGQSSLPYESYTEYSGPFPSQQQAFEKLSPSPRARPSLVNPVAPARPSQAKSTPPRMSKTEALAFVSKCKRWLIAGSIVAFGVLSGLVAGQLTATASSQPSNSSTDTSSSNGGFFQQQQQQQGGYGFGNGGFGRSSFSGSRTS